jgi:hypothetical protein
VWDTVEAKEVGAVALRDVGELDVPPDGSVAVAAAAPASWSGTQQAVAWTDERTLVATNGDEVVGLSADLVPLWSMTVPYAAALDYSAAAGLLAIGSWQRGV